MAATTQLMSAREKLALVAPGRQDLYRQALMAFSIAEDRMNLALTRTSMPTERALISQVLEAIREAVDSLPIISKDD